MNKPVYNIFLARVGVAASILVVAALVVSVVAALSPNFGLSDGWWAVLYLPAMFVSALSDLFCNHRYNRRLLEFSAQAR